MVKVRTLYNPLFEAAGADLVLAGHSHTYERSMLIDGHYGLSNSLTPENIIDAGDGDPLSNGAYFKPTTGNAPHEGTVYVVNGVGENAHADGGTLDHPAMVSSFEIEGSMVIDIWCCCCWGPLGWFGDAQATHKQSVKTCRRYLRSGSSSPAT
jgi:hypothetical protein